LGNAPGTAMRYGGNIKFLRTAKIGVSQRNQGLILRQLMLAILIANALLKRLLSPDLGLFVLGLQLSGFCHFLILYYAVIFIS